MHEGCSEEEEPASPISLRILLLGNETTGQPEQGCQAGSRRSSLKLGKALGKCYFNVGTNHQGQEEIAAGRAPSQGLSYTEEEGSGRRGPCHLASTLLLVPTSCLSLALLSQPGLAVHLSVSCSFAGLVCLLPACPPIQPHPCAVGKTIGAGGRGQPVCVTVCFVRPVCT